VLAAARVSQAQPAIAAVWCPNQAPEVFFKKLAQGIDR